MSGEQSNVEKPSILKIRMDVSQGETNEISRVASPKKISWNSPKAQNSQDFPRNSEEFNQQFLITGNKPTVTRSPIDTRGADGMSPMNKSPTRPIELSAFEQLDTVKLPAGNTVKAAEFLEQRLLLLTRIINQFYKDNEKMSVQQKGYLENSLLNLKELESQVEKFIEEEKGLQIENTKALEESQANLKEAESEVTRKKHVIDEKEALIKEVKEVIKEKNFERKEITAVLQDKVDLLKDMKLIKDKEKINDLFSWIWRHLYDQKQEAYEFTHFKREVFIKDRGIDLQMRIMNYVFEILQPAEKGMVQGIAKEKETIVKAYSTKKAENMALRALYEFAEMLLTMSEKMEELQQLNEQLYYARMEHQEKTDALEKLTILTNILQNKVDFSRKFINTFNGTLPMIQSLKKLCEWRAKDTEKHYLRQRGALFQSGLTEMQMLVDETQKKKNNEAEGSDTEQVKFNQQYQLKYRKAVKSGMTDSTDVMMQGSDPAKQSGCTCTLI